ncbi:MAG: hypothetical protein J6T28_04160 [Paludibacteraceae bacterium]|nr:hypothetical protein [Paludibacteraceae bacterium]
MKHVYTILWMSLINTCLSFAMNGTGTQEDPYQISTADELYEFAQIINGTHPTIEPNWDACAILTSDIVVNDTLLGNDGNVRTNEIREWTPIGDLSKATGFRGVFDGKGHTISGLYCSSNTTDGLGLFAYSTGEIRNIGVLDSYFEGADNVGGICGYNAGAISYCYCVSTVLGNENVGGIVGWSNDPISFCYAIGKIADRTGRNAAYGSLSSGENCYDLKNSKAQDFKSGHIAYLLQEGEQEHVWGQKIGVDTFPILFSTDTVYISSKCKAQYTNDTINPTDHVPANCKCIYCGEAAHTYKNCICAVCKIEKPDCEHEHLFEYGFCLCGEEDPNFCLDIETVEDLYGFAEAVATINDHLNARLLNDIVINKNVLDSAGNLTEGNFRGWAPIQAYKGTFDGMGHTIHGIYIKEDSTDYLGLFALIEQAGVVKNLGIKDSWIKGRIHNGFIAGHNKGVITNCSNGGTIEYPRNYSGGIVGLNEGTVSSCSNYGVIMAEGGICGMNNKGTIEGCVNYGTVFTGSYYAGICGTQEAGAIVNCINTGVIGHQGSRYAGICAELNGGEIRSCLSTQTESITYAGRKNITHSVYQGNKFAKNSDSTYTVTINQIRSGLACHILNGNRDGEGLSWGQTIGVDTLPVLGGAAIYPASTVCPYRFSNEEGQDLPHDAQGYYSCVYCGKYIVDIDTIKIYTVDDLYRFADYVYNHKPTVNAILMNDIVINENVLDETGKLNNGKFREWICKRKDGDSYQGVFEGNKHVIKGIYIEKGGDRAGFFSTISNGEVRNLGIEDSYISSGNGRCGGICGQSWASTINNCYFIGVIKCGGGEVGGICSTAGTNSTISNCFAICQISGQKPTDSICPINKNSEITNCYAMTLTEPSDSERRHSFENGRFTYLLQNGQKEYVWGQKIGTDPHPVFNGDTVYSSECPYYFSNDANAPELSTYPHIYDHCVCTQCGYRDTTCVCEHVEKNGICIYCGIMTHEFDNCYCVNCNAKDTTCTDHEHRFDYCLCVCGERDTTTQCCFDIYTLDDLYEFAKKVNKGNRWLNARLMNDIVVNETPLEGMDYFVEMTHNKRHEELDMLEYSFEWEEWDEYIRNQPVKWQSGAKDSYNNIIEGNLYNGVYSGVFDGQGHVINGLIIGYDQYHGSYVYCGLFSTVNGAEFKNLGLENCIVYGPHTDNYQVIIGTFCGYALNSSFTNCHTSGNIYVGTYEAKGLGGLVGQAYGCTFQNCYNLADIWGFRNVAGIVGNIADIGWISDAECGYAGTSMDDMIKFPGEVVVMKNCWNAGNITSSDPLCGGLLNITPKASLSLSNCFNIGDVISYSSNENNSGGLIGYGFSPFLIKLENCYNAGSVYYERHPYSADLVTSHYNDRIIEYNIADINPDTLSETKQYLLYSNCYYLADSTLIRSPYATAEKRNRTSEIDIHPMTLEQFANGEVCYRLNQGVTDGTQPFYQDLNDVRVRPTSARPAPVTIDPYPVLDNTHRTVYTDGTTYFNYPPTSSSVEDAANDSSSPIIYVMDRTIYVCNVDGRILLSDMNGRTLFSQKVEKLGTTSCAEIPVRGMGVYLLVVDGKPYKVTAR